MLIGELIANPTPHEHPIEVNLRFAVGVGLALISGIFTIGLLLSLGNKADPVQQGILILTGILLEGAKVLLYRMRRHHKVLAVSLMMISIIASFGAALGAIEAKKAQATAIEQSSLRESYQYQQAQRSIASLDAQIDGLVHRLQAMPTDFISASKALNEQIKALRAERSSIILDLKAQEKDSLGSNPPAILFTSIGSLTGLPTDLLALVLSLVVAVIIEMSIICLMTYQPWLNRIVRQVQSHSVPNLRAEAMNQAFPHKQTEPLAAKEGYSEVFKAQDEETIGTGEENRGTGYYGPTMGNITPEIFLEAMVDPQTWPILRGRDATARLLGGIPQSVAKRLVRELVATGKVVVEGKRLKATTQIPTTTHDQPSQEGSSQKADQKQASPSSFSALGGES